MSQAMRIAMAGVVRNRRAGRMVYYRLDDDHIRICWSCPVITSLTWPTTTDGPRPRTRRSELRAGARHQQRLA